jgi:hypothetical protein
MQFFYRRHGGGLVTLHGEDSCRGRYLEDQVPIMGNSHEPVQGRSANDGVEWEVQLRNFELYVLYVEVYLCPERDQQGDGPHWVDGMRAHSGEWARRVQLGLRDLQLFERCIADDAEAGTSVDQHVVELDVGNGGDGDKW